MWFGGMNGLTGFYPEQIKDNPYIPPVVITSLSQGGVPIDRGMAIERVKEIRLAWPYNFFEFEFTAFNYTQPSKNRYQFMLEGFDKNWFDSGTRRFGRYTGLPSGNYRLIVKGSNNDGIWNNTGTSIMVHVDGPFWKTRWFYGLFVLGGTLILVSVFLYMLKLNNEIRERKQAEKALRESEDKYRRLAENAQDMIYRMSLPDGKYEYVSPASTEIVGYSPEEFYNSPGLVRKTIHPDWLSYYEEQWGRLLAGDMPPEYEYQIIHKSGEARWLFQRNVLIRDHENQPIAMEGIVTDITKRKQTEEEKKELSVRLQRAEKMEAIGTLAGGVAHDLNNVLSSLVGYPDLLLMDLPADSHLKEAVLTIQNQGKKAAAIVEDLLTLARRGVAISKVTNFNDVIGEYIQRKKWEEAGQGWVWLLFGGR
jgi:PAS domain S-box-containing protein